MEAGSDDGAKVGEPSGGLAKPKRQMKTPFQLETLEKSFAMDQYPSEAARVELSEKLGLSDRQLQMWFCHRRLKEKNNIPNKKPRKSAAVTITPEYVRESSVPRPDPGSDYRSGSGSGSSRDLQRVGFRRDVDDVGVGRRHCESPRTIMELRAIACVEAQLGEPLREDGPILGMEFDPLPPDAFGEHTGSMEELRHSDRHYDNKAYGRHDMLPSKATGRSIHEYKFLQDQPSMRYNSHGKGLKNHFHEVPIEGESKTSGHGNEKLSRIHGVQGHQLRVCHASSEDREGPGGTPPEDDYPHRDGHGGVKLSTAQMGDAYPVINGKVFHNESAVHVERKRKNEEPKSAREVEVHEIRMRKALEKENILRQKNEERMKKEMERYDRERQKEEERLKREQQKEEERLLREQKREIERKEKFMQKESIRAEKMRQREEQRREKEAERRKVALERATARRIAKESMELMDDELLELMELAASKKGLSSIVNLDHDTLQNLDMFRDSLSTFPPQSVQLKRPFAVQPWSNSEDNIGNLFMAWRFLVTFADVLGLWPFTLDEFVQALHDYDSRLLGEVHITLLKSIIKDIEDVARTPDTGSGMHQNGGANPEGGHPHIVEGAYAWGFDIQKWQKHLNPLTWPEIFRQLALSAGFGPQLKKRSTVQPLLQEGNDVKDCKDVVSTLRSGSAAAKALSIMRDKGLLLPRRSRHRLTPGTLKFAAFHVLSLEGGKGLTVLELADKIQKFGLRDLRTSKTPEASISVALTRDTKLFERIAPSTYCVRSAFRKDPADADAILSDARKKIRMFENGLLTGEDADAVERDDDLERVNVVRDDDVERDDVERDEDSEGVDDDEEPDTNDFATPSSANKGADQYEQVSVLPVIKEEILVGAEVVPVSDFKNDNSAVVPNQYCEDIGDAKTVPESMEIDESTSYESWVHGLSEGEYSHLSVEERLTALVALIGIANEGNSIRTVLEDRLEAASALKKQILAEVQVDKSRIKDDFISKLEISSSLGAEGIQSPIRTNKVVSPSPNEVTNTHAERNVAAHESSALPDISSHGYVSRKSRSQLKTYIAQRAEEKYVYRSLPLGQDRRHNRYWQFVTCASRNDPGSGRIFVELMDGSWRIIDSEEAFDTLLMALDVRGIREAFLRLMLLTIKPLFKSSIRRARHNTTSVKPDSPGSPTSTVYKTRHDTEASSSFKIEICRNESEKKSAMRRYSDFQKLVWTECYNGSTLSALKVGVNRSDPLLGICNECLTTYFYEDKVCPSCHDLKSKSYLKAYKTFATSVPIGIQLVKAVLVYIEVSIPLEALDSVWTADVRKKWGEKLIGSQSTEELLQMLTVLESAVKRDYLSSDFETTKELLRLSGNSVVEFANTDRVSLLPWIPQTTSAVSLRLLELDASIAYVKREEEHVEQDTFLKEHNTRDLSNEQKTGKRGGNRKRKWTGGSGGERKRRSSFTAMKSRYRDDLSNGYSRGPRTIRKRRTESTNKGIVVEEPLLAQFSRPKMMGESSSRGFSDGWRRQSEDFSAVAECESEEEEEEAAAESDENGDVRFGYDDDGVGPSSNGWNKDRMEVTEEEASEEDDDGGEAEVEEDYRLSGVNVRDDGEYRGRIDQVVESEDEEENNNDEGSESAVSDDYSD